MTSGRTAALPAGCIRIIAPTPGTIHLELAWQPKNPGSPLHLWAGGRRFTGDLTEGRLVVDAAVSAGENVLYIGYYRPSMLFGSSMSSRSQRQ